MAAAATEVAPIVSTVLWSVLGTIVFLVVAILVFLWGCRVGFEGRRALELVDADVPGLPEIDDLRELEDELEQLRTQVQITDELIADLYETLRSVQEHLEEVEGEAKPRVDNRIRDVTAAAGAAIGRAHDLRQDVHDAGGPAAYELERTPPGPTDGYVDDPVLEQLEQDHQEDPP